MTMPNVRFVLAADVGRRKILRDARKTTSVKLRRGVVAKYQGRHRAESDGNAAAAEHLARRAAA